MHQGVVQILACTQHLRNIILANIHIKINMINIVFAILAAPLKIGVQSSHYPGYKPAVEASS